jgi:hypothetical protein
MSVILEHMKNIGDNGVILACAHSNFVLNEWIRKIVGYCKQSQSQLTKNIAANTIIDSKGILFYSKMNFRRAIEHQDNTCGVIG